VRRADRGGRDSGADALAAPRPGVDAMPPPGATAETEALRGDIAQTRSELSGTIDAIQDRLNPDRLMEQAREQVREQVQEHVQEARDAVRDATIGKAEDVVRNVSDTATEARSTLMETIRQNPIPAAMVGLGLGWLWMNRQRPPATRWSTRQATVRYTSPTAGYRDWGAYDDRGRYYDYDRDRGASGSAMGQVRDTAGRVTSRVGDAAGDAADQVQDTASRLTDQVQTTAGNLASGAQYQAQRLEDRFQRAMWENPLAVGAAAVALGAVVGLAIPETEQENEWMGEARDTVVEKAQSVAQDTMQKVQGVAEQAGQAAQQAAREQGLTPS
jgi:ElaB/YqjD/DUF883 family membrane-anchored ribosome-binding protein